ncbi:translation initiation factor eIF2B subunit epsilon isoform X2 [Tribolium castaneum]|uniref:translation initiation factor eIF2B subunit epsilon isoform X2 n=1 Tax=Tribolium castaneum TaxID=7070 RepID=UPI00046C27F9|nr:PREDICTED: translation initiation factor eIF-2B subunit epsilon isoform X2 [Tribolium castaneum]|eukprot:XP_008192840.1 PREDICTED: translation initiation factor eIF-2B subunit epsilon isoform X2 [Tribolium castaneum]
MSIKSKDDIIQAVVVADTFGDEFLPLSSDIPLALFPLINRPLIDYTLEFLSLGGIEETFLFCCSHTDAIKAHINQSVKDKAGWSLTMKVNVIVSESCHSFGDCLRDLDRKGILRGNFVLLEPGTLSNIKLLPIVKKHNEVANKDKGAAMTVIYQEAGIGQMGRDLNEEVVVAVNNNNRVLFHRKLGQSRDRKIEFPLEIFLENSNVSLHHNLKDTHIAICSPSVLPLFSDNFDFQSKDDFVKGLLMNEEILGSTVYCHVTKGSHFGGAITNWRMYQAISHELQNKWIYPLQPPALKAHNLKNGVVTGDKVVLNDNKKIANSIIGDNVTIGKNVQIEHSFILSNTKIADNVIITHSVIGPNCHIKANSRITASSIIGKDVVIENEQFIENSLVQSTQPENCEEKDKLGKKAFRLKLETDDDDLGALSRKLSQLHIGDSPVEESEDEAFTDSEDEELSYTQSPVPDDTKCKFQRHQSYFNYVVEISYWSSVFLSVCAFIVILCSDPEELHTQ